MALQNEYSLLHRDPEQGMGDSLLTNDNLDLVERLIEFTASRGHTLLDLAFAWLLARPSVASVIAGVTKPSQIEQNVKAVRWTLSDQELSEVDKIAC